MQDISNEKRMENLEKVFLHDLLNTAGSLNGLLTMLKTETDPNEERALIEMSEEASRDIIDEINIHRKFRQAENGDLVPDFKFIKVADIVNSVVEKIKGDFVSRNKMIQISEIPDDMYFETDRMLFSRVLTNMVRNALEATDEGGNVKIRVMDSTKNVRFEVQNNVVMKQEVKHQIFQRSFSTKGTGRGTGTYSIKLLTENYLNGIAGFVSTEDIGTMFFVEFLKGK